MRKLLLLLCLNTTLHTISNAQFLYRAEKLTVLDTIYENPAIARLNEQRLQYISPDFFTVSKYGNQSGLFLIAKEKNFCLAINLPTGQTSTPDNIKYNGTYIYYETTSSSASRGNLQSSRSFILLHPSKKFYFEIPSMLNEETWNPDIENERSVTKSCNCKISLEQDAITSFQFERGLSDCLGTGKYRITNDSLIKYQHYDESNYRMADIKWAGRIATWMTLNDVKSIYPGAIIEKTVNRFSSCAEDERPAYSIVDENDTLAICFLDGDEKYIQKIIALSNNIRFGKITTGSTAKEVLSIYPKAIIHTDLLSEYEYIFLPELNIKLIFNSTETSRVGKYMKEQYIGLSRPAARIDYIEIN